MASPCRRCHGPMRISLSSSYCQSAVHSSAQKSRLKRLASGYFLSTELGTPTQSDFFRLSRYYQDTIVLCLFLSEEKYLDFYSIVQYLRVKLLSKNHLDFGHLLDKFFSFSYFSQPFCYKLQIRIISYIVNYHSRLHFLIIFYLISLHIIKQAGRRVKAEKLR